MADELPKKDFKDRYGKEKGDAVRYATATNIVKKKLGIKEDKADMMFKKLSQRAQTYVNELLRSGMGTMEAIQKAKEKFKEGDMKNEEMRLRVEAIAGLKKKAEKSGMPYSILKKVYDRGMAAWKGGHRPGASQHQWAFARVNSFVTKSSGTWGGADKDLAAKVRGSK
jgi:predicted DNA binding CopG/RHH family protein